MASFTKTGKGWRAQVYVQGVRDSATHRTRREAEAWAARRETELREHIKKLPGERIALREVLQRYADEVSPGKRGERWELLRLQAFAESVLPVDLPIARVTAEHIALWRDSRLGQVQAGTVLREFNLLSSVLEQARREWRLIDANPARDVRRPRAPDHREVVITRAQIKAMLAAMGYSPGKPVREARHAVAACFLVALRTGMRAGELCGLTWDRVYADHVTTPHKMGRTAQSLRTVPIDAKAARLIGRMRGWDERLVFGVKTASLDAMFRKYRQRAGMDGFTFHDSRHTAATWMARRVDVLTLCKVFGWAQTTQALTYYNPSASSIAEMLNRR